MLYPLKENGEFFLFIALLYKLNAVIEDLFMHFGENNVVGLPRVRVKVFVDSFLDFNFIRNNKILLSYLLLTKMIARSQSLCYEIIRIKFLS